MKAHDDGFDPFNFKDLDKLIEKFFGNISNLPNLGEGKPKTHHHSVTYRFGNSMDNPEIRINGKKVDDETIKDFMESLGPNVKMTPSRIRLGSDEGITELDVKDLSITESLDYPSIQYEDTYFEIEHEGYARIVTIELPGIEKDQIKISQSGSTVIIIGESKSAKYKAEFQLDFKYKNKKITGMNSIYQIRFTK